MLFGSLTRTVRRTREGPRYVHIPPGRWRVTTRQSEHGRASFSLLPVAAKLASRSQTPTIAPQPHQTVTTTFKSLRNLPQPGSGSFEVVLVARGKKNQVGLTKRCSIRIYSATVASTVICPLLKCDTETISLWRCIHLILKVVFFEKRPRKEEVSLIVTLPFLFYLCPPPPTVYSLKDLNTIKWDLHECHQFKKKI